VRHSGRVAAWVALLLAAGCAHSYRSQPLHDATAAIPIEPGAPVLVGMPEPGSYKNRVYERSSADTSGALREALQSEGFTVEVAPRPESFDRGLDRARQIGALYFVYPQIRDWRDHATEWSGVPDVIEIEIGVYDARSGEILRAVRIDATSRWATLGGDHPQDLLARPVAEFARSLTRREPGDSE